MIATSYQVRKSLTNAADDLENNSGIEVFDKSVATKKR